MKRAIISGRRAGKTLATEAARDDFVRQNPKATILTTRHGGIVVEKYVEQSAPTFVGIDNASGPDMKVEVQGRMSPDGKVVITAIRNWKHELELTAEPDPARSR